MKKRKAGSNKKKEGNRKTKLRKKERNVKLY